MLAKPGSQPVRTVSRRPEGAVAPRRPEGTSPGQHAAGVAAQRSPARSTTSSPNAGVALRTAGSGAEPGEPDHPPTTPVPARAQTSLPIPTAGSPVTTLTREQARGLDIAVRENPRLREERSQARADLAGVQQELAVQRDENVQLAQALATLTVAGEEQRQRIATLTETVSELREHGVTLTATAHQLGAHLQQRTQERDTRTQERNALQGLLQTQQQQLATTNASRNRAWGLQVCASRTFLLTGITGLSATVVLGSLRQFLIDQADDSLSFAPRLIDTATGLAMGIALLSGLGMTTLGCRFRPPAPVVPH